MNPDLGIEALSQTGGVWKLRKGGIASDVVLRGFQSRDLNVLIGGNREGISSLISAIVTEACGGLL
jgi:hypothetical protein